MTNGALRMQDTYLTKHNRQIDRSKDQMMSMQEPPYGDCD